MKKILVIADDFTGAAEIAGIGLRYGLAGVVVRGDAVAQRPHPCPVTVIDTDSRSLPPKESAARVRRAIQLFRMSDDALLFKKIDSVLRGPVVAEVDAALAATGRSSAIVVPANPSRGRIIREGHYLVSNVPLDLTEFADDPQYPARTSAVVDRVGRLPHVHSIDVSAPIRPGIAIGNAESPADMHAWAARASPAYLPVGAADFFAALLEHAGHHPADQPATPEAEDRKVLLVSGTPSAVSQSALKNAEECGALIRDMPQSVFVGAVAAADMLAWRDAILGDLHRHGRALVAVRHPVDQARTQWVADRLSEAVAAVLSVLSGPSELYVEGGSTASRLARHMDWHEFTALRELAPGVVCLAITGQRTRWLTIKPGSYPWPREIWGRLV